MRRHLILGSVLALASIGAPGCSIISAIAKNSKDKEAAAEKSADEKRLADAKSANDLDTLAKGCEKGKHKDWCGGYQEVFMANLGAMQCDKAWSDWKANAKDTGLSKPDNAQAMSLKLAECDDWPVYYGDFLTLEGNNAVRGMDNRLEKSFLAYVQTNGGDALSDNDTNNVFRRILELEKEGALKQTCGEYLTVADTYKARSPYLTLLGRLECAAALPLFEEGLLSEEKYVRAASCKALGKVGAEKHIKSLENLAWTDSAEGPDYTMPVREACRDAMGKLKTRLGV